MQTRNPYVTTEQERLRELVFSLFKEEIPLDPKDLKQLAPFVRRVREEFVENTTPGQRALRRVEYFVLNARGRHLYQQWEMGKLDGYADGRTPVRLPS
jgi:hypothetical protein